VCDCFGDCDDSSDELPVWAGCATFCENSASGMAVMTIFDYKLNKGCFKFEFRVISFKLFSERFNGFIATFVYRRIFFPEIQYF
jgi:hypothetical protein